MLALNVIVLAFAWWLGLYLLARDPSRPLLRRAGLGLAVYALALAADLLSAAAPDAPPAATFARAHLALIFAPALCWAGALVQLLPEDHPLREPLDRAWAYAVGPAFVLLALTVNRPDRSFLAVALIVLAPLAGLLVLVARALYATRPRNAAGLAIAATLFFTLGLALLILPLGLLPRAWGLLAIGADLLVFDVAIAALDAFDEGETLWPDIARSFAGALFSTLLFGLPIAAALLLAGCQAVGNVASGAAPRAAPGPARELRVGDKAPDFTLSDPQGKQKVTLSSFRGKKPVVLIFGSYT